MYVQRESSTLNDKVIGRTKLCKTQRMIGLLHTVVKVMSYTLETVYANNVAVLYLVGLLCLLKCISETSSDQRQPVLSSRAERDPPYCRLSIIPCIIIEAVHNILC